MLEVQGEIVRSHIGEDGIKVVDEFRITGVSYRQRDCLCRRCLDGCITSTGSEYCSDCEVSFALGGSCHA